MLVVRDCPININGKVIRPGLGEDSIVPKELEDQLTAGQRWSCVQVADLPAATPPATVAAPVAPAKVAAPLGATGA